MKPDKLRIVVAEDSPTARRLLVEILRADPAFEVVGEAKDGLEALELTRRLRPHLVTMDIQMPNMDGLEATKRIMTDVPTPVVVVSTLVERDIQTSMTALRSGALAVLQKLVGPQAPDFEDEARRLRDTLKAMAQVKVVRHWPSRDPSPISRAPAVPVRRGKPAVLTIAASTGGPAALHAIFSKLPAGYPLPILVVQHIALGFSKGLATWLDSTCELEVKVAEDGEALKPGVVYIASDDRHLGMREDGRVEVSNAAPVGGFRPSGTWLLPLGHPGVRLLHPRRRPHRHGTGRTRGPAGSPRGRRPGAGPGRGLQRRLWDARGGHRRGPRRRGARPGRLRPAPVRTGGSQTPHVPLRHPRGGGALPDQCLGSGCCSSACLLARWREMQCGDKTEVLFNGKEVSTSFRGTP